MRMRTTAVILLSALSKALPFALLSEPNDLLRMKILLMLPMLLWPCLWINSKTKGKILSQLMTKLLHQIPVRLTLIMGIMVMGGHCCRMSARMSYARTSMAKERLLIPRCYRKLRIEVNMALNLEISRPNLGIGYIINKY